jgi:hemoglobin
MHRRAHRLFATSLLVLTALACESQGEPGDETAARDTAAQTAQATLYQRLGGATAIRSVVDTLVAHAAMDEQLNFTRAGTENEWEATPENVELLKERLVQFVGSVTGGPEQYEGQDMVTAHQGMQITNEEFDRLGGHLQMALRVHDVPEELQNELFEIVETTRPQIVRADSAR